MLKLFLYVLCFIVLVTLIVMIHDELRNMDKRIEQQERI